MTTALPKLNRGRFVIFKIAKAVLIATAIISPIHHHKQHHKYKFKHHHECVTLRCVHHANELWAKLHKPKVTESESSSYSGWVIPEYIVRCESSFQNLEPNSAGASGYYQIIPGTWEENGGSPPNEAWRHSKGEQDRVAARIWATAGPSAWVCASS